jgi:hypothetical protein
MRFGLLLAAVSFADDGGAIGRLGWMAGCWSMQSGASTIEETWTTPAGGMMLGTSRTMKGGKTVFHEFMRISVENGTVIYTPRIGSSEKPVNFKLVKQGEEEVVFENLSHDFPQRIIYRKAEDGLFARIEGERDRKLRGQDFPMKRRACL